MFFVWIKRLHNENNFLNFANQIWISVKLRNLKVIKLALKQIDTSTLQSHWSVCSFNGSFMHLQIQRKLPITIFYFISFHCPRLFAAFYTGNGSFDAFYNAAEVFRNLGWTSL